MPIQYHAMTIPELVLEAKREGIDLTLNRVGKLDWHDRTLTANPMLQDCRMQRWTEIEQYLQEHPLLLSVLLHSLSDEEFDQLVERPLSESHDEPTSRVLHQEHRFRLE